MRPNFELLRRAFEIIDGIPDDQLHLSKWTCAEGDANYCGTIACAGGWLMRHPEFNALGLRENRRGENIGFPTFKGVHGFDALAGLFCLPLHGEKYLFNHRSSASFPYYDGSDVTDDVSEKTVFLRRIIKLLDHYGQHVDATVRARVFA